jgi:hypothetical protein
MFIPALIVDSYIDSTIRETNQGVNGMTTHDR